jgi:hypothetical protein
MEAVTRELFFIRVTAAPAAATLAAPAPIKSARLEANIFAERFMSISRTC